MKKSRLDSSGQSMINFINTICENIGPRPAGSKNEHEAGDLIYQEFEKFSDEVSKHNFSCHPQGFLDFIWLTALFYLLGFFAYLILNPLVSAILILIALGIYFVQQNLLFEVIDFLFPKKESFHVIGKIKPEKEAKKLILLSGHYDSAYEFPLLSKLGAKSAIIIVSAIIISLVNILLASFKFVLMLNSSVPSDPFSFLRFTENQLNTIETLNLIQFIIFLVGTIIILTLAFTLRSNKSVLGANDNLTGIATIWECGKYLAQNKPKQTEVWLVSFAGEEHMRGSKRFVSKFKDELQERDAMLFNLECLSADKFLLATGENMFLAKHSLQVVDKVNSAAKRVNIPIEIGPLRFAGSDAANFSRKGLKATTLFGLSDKGTPKNWHTLEDTPDKLNGQSIVKGAEIALQFVYDVDEEIL